LKKEAKNFCSLAYAVQVKAGRVCQLAKVFWFFFQKITLSLMMSATRSAIMIVAAFVFPETIRGITDASTTRNP
jgi:hypothetical protein